LLELYFIRHGQSTNNVLYEGDHEDYMMERDTDPDLTQKGREQARLVAAHLASSYMNNGYDPQNRNGFGLTHLYCSLMIRAVKTGIVISKTTRIPLMAWPEVHETGGIFEMKRNDGQMIALGKPGPGRSYFENNFPELVLPEEMSENGWWGRDKETRENYDNRAQAIVKRIKTDHLGRDHRVGIVTHGGIFTHILKALFDVRADQYWFLMNNCGITRVDIEDDGHVLLAYMNKTDFLPGHLVT